MARLTGEGLVVSCSWCHRAVPISDRRQFCPECGHRADVARVDCDCGREGCKDARTVHRVEIWNLETWVIHNAASEDEARRVWRTCPVGFFAKLFVNDALVEQGSGPR
jgi:predicted amidophosphoribosyltransferase